jgi:hypothetical protein
MENRVNQTDRTIRSDINIPILEYGHLFTHLLIQKPFTSAFPDQLALPAHPAA